MTGKNSISERARLYIAAMPGAISGAGGHDQTFAVVCKLVEFGLTPGEAWPLLVDYNCRCVPPWSERELQHKLQDAFQRASPRAGFIRRRVPIYNFVRVPQIKIDPVAAVEKFLCGFRCGEADLWEASPVRLPDDWTKDGVILLEHLYCSNERINFVTSFTMSTNANETRKANPIGKGETIKRDELMALWRKQLPGSDAGGWLRMNPMDGCGTNDANVTAFRFALAECDSIPVELQLSLLAKLPLPIAAIVTSGGRSLHAWVRVDADILEEYRTTVSQMLALLGKFGVDGQNKNPSRMSRLPGVTRLIGAHADGRQRLLYLNPQPKQKTIL